MNDIGKVREMAGVLSKLTEVFGITPEHFEALGDAVQESFNQIASERSTETVKCIGFLEEALHINDYTSEQVLRLVFLLREISKYARMQGKDEAMTGMALLLR